MDSSGAIGLDESPSPSSPSSPLPQPRSTGLRSLFFSGAEEEAEESLLPPQEADGDVGSASEAEWTSEPSGSLDDSEPGSWTESSAGEKPAQLLSKAQMRRTAETAVIVGTGMAHTVAAKTDAQKQVGLYLADADDARNIGHPLADLMHRRGDLVGGKLSPDANDFLRSLMGVAGYFTKQIQKIGVIRQLEAGQGRDPQTLPQEG